MPGGSDGKVSAMQESWVQSLGLEDFLEKEMATHSSILDWKENLLLWMEESGRIQAMGSQRVGQDGKPFNITVIQVYAPTSNTEEAEVERFYEYLQDLLELTPKKDVLFIIGDWNAKVGSQETPGVTGKFGLGMRNEAGQRPIEFCQENALVIANTLFQQHKRRLHMNITRWSTPKSD